MWRRLYQTLLLLSYPVVRARLWWRSRREPEYGQRIAERFGHVPAHVPARPVWFHTVSAGETIAAAPVVQALADDFPELEFLVTTMTPTGSAQARGRLGEIAAHCYAPYDFRWAVRRFYDAVQPRILILMETELWPNLIDEAHRRGVPVLLVNARLSERSARGYARIGSLTREMLLQVRFIACQYPDHARRFLELGAVPDRVSALGSVKFDVSLPHDHAARVAALRQLWRLDSRPVWIAGSTHPGEDEIVLASHTRVRRTHPDACLLLVPRHPARIEDVERLVKEAELSSLRQSVSEDESTGERADVILGDTMGQLLYLYGLAEVAFIGGSLVPVGGHNPIEAAVCGAPIVMGPQTFNFPDVVGAFRDAGCLSLVRDAGSLAEVVSGLLGDAAERQRLGAAAHRVVENNTGATERLLKLLRAEIAAARTQ